VVDRADWDDTTAGSASLLKREVAIAIIASFVVGSAALLLAHGLDARFFDSEFALGQFSPLSATRAGLYKRKP
jgi:hypothetical protein